MGFYQFQPRRSRNVSPLRRQGKLTAVADVDDVAVFDNIVLALKEELTSLLEFHFGGMPHVTCAGEFTVFHHLGPNETAGKITVNRMSGVDGSRAVADCPGAHFVLTSGEEGDVAQRLVE